MSYAEDHVDAFNRAVVTGGWKSFAERFAESAVLEFVGPPVGPFIGRAAILNAYIENPPDDTIEINGPVIANAADLVIPYKWTTTGGTGTMLVALQGDEIAHLRVIFD